MTWAYEIVFNVTNYNHETTTDGRCPHVTIIKLCSQLEKGEYFNRYFLAYVTIQDVFDELDQTEYVTELNKTLQ